MAKKKVAMRRQRVPNGHVRIEIIVPMETSNRIARHCQDNNISPTAFYKEAIYNVLPVKYEVDKQFVFPFGKYTGETAGSVQEFDPDYLTWCCKNISGFALIEEMQLAPTEVEKRHVQHEEYKQKLRNGEVLLYGAWQADNTRKAFARRFTPWGESRWRYLGTQTKE